jgi:hypothetical protein
LAQLFDRVAYVDLEGPNLPEILRIQGVRIIFKVEKSSERTTNRAEIDIYNLNSDTRGKIEAGSEQRISLCAGYVQAGGAQQIFRGDIVQVEHRIETPEVITHIEAEDGQAALRQTRVSMSFEAGATALWVIDKIVSELRAQVPNSLIGWVQSSTLGNREYNHGFSFTGPAVEALDKVAKYLEARWMVTNGMLQILPLNGTLGLAQTNEVYISPQSGMMGSPNRLMDIGGVLDVTEDQPGPEQNQVVILKPAKTIDGYSIRSLLQPSINPLFRVELHSDRQPDVRGQFGVMNLTHSGDTHGEIWETDLEVTRILS